MSVFSLPMTAGVIVIGLGNDGRQCPPSPVLIPVTVLDKSAPEHNYCFSVGPSGNTLVGYTDPFKTAQWIVWTPFAETPPAALTLGEEVSSAPPPRPSTPPPSGPPIQLLSWFLPPIPAPVIPITSVPPPVITPDPPKVTPDPPLTTGTPEASTMLLCAAGLLGLGLCRGRRA